MSFTNTEMARGALGKTHPWMLIADMHFKRSRLDRMHETVQWLIKVFHETRPSHVMILGDTFHMRDVVDVATLQMVKKFQDALSDAEWKPHIHYLVGNHDMSDKYDRTVNIPSILENVKKNIHVYSEITVKLLDGETCVFIPYHEDQNEIRSYLRDTFPIELDRKNITIFCHIALDGAKVNGESDHSNRICTGANLSLKDFIGFKRVFAGHFHHHAVYENFAYVGSPLMLTFGDANQHERGTIFYRPQENTWSLEVNPSGSYFINLEYDEALTADVKDKDVRIFVRDPLVTEEQLTELYQSLLDKGPTSLRFEKVFSSHTTEVATNEIPLDDAETPADEMTKRLQTFIGTKIVREKVPDFLGYMSPFIQVFNSSPSTAVGTFVADLKTVKIQNFMGVKGSILLNYSILPRGSCQVIGPNGAGKSLQVDAICWCLFGVIPRGGKVDDIPFKQTSSRNDVPSVCSVSVSFLNGYEITRTRKKGKIDIQIKRPDGLVIEKVAKMMEEEIVRLLKTNYKMFQRTVQINSGNLTRLFTSNDEDRTNILETILGFDAFDAIHSDIETNAKSVKEELSKVELELSMVSQRSHSKEKEREKMESHATTLRERYCSLKADLEAFHGKLSKLSTDKNEAVIRLEDRKEHLRQYEEDWRKAVKEKSTLDDELLQYAKLIERRTNVERSLDQNAEKMKTLEDELNTLSEDNVRPLLDELAKSEETLKKVTMEKEESVQSAKNALQRELDRFHERQNQALEELKMQMKALDARRSKIEQELESIREEKVQNLLTVQETIQEKALLCAERCKTVQEAEHNVTHLKNHVETTAVLQKVQLEEQLRLEESILDIENDVEKNHSGQLIDIILELRDLQMEGLSDIISSLSVLAKDMQLSSEHKNLILTVLKAKRTSDSIDSLRESLHTLEEQICVNNALLQEQQANVEKLKDELRILDYDLESYRSQALSLTNSLKKRTCNETALAENLFILSETQKNLSSLEDRIRNVEKLSGENVNDERVTTVHRMWKICSAMQDKVETETAIWNENTQKAKDEFEELSRRHLHLQSAKKDVERITKELSSVKEESESFQTTLIELDNIIPKSHDDMELKRENLMIDIDGLENMILKDVARDVESWTNRLAVVEKEIQDVTLAENTTRTLFDETGAQISLIDAELVTLNSDLENLTVETGRLKSSQNVLLEKRRIQSFWMDALVSNGKAKARGEFRRYCLKETVKKINRLLKKNLALLGEDAVHQLDCELNDELNIVVRGKGKLSFSQLSEGEKKRVQLALLFAIFTITLTQSPFKPQFLFFDEIFDSLDDTGRLLVQKWISNFGRVNPTMRTFIITHMNVMGGQQDCTINVKKDRRNGSVYTVQGLEFMKRIV
jgi:DNA repair exonuclease SbcCD ATPase subunit